MNVVSRYDGSCVNFAKFNLDLELSQSVPKPDSLDHMIFVGRVLFFGWIHEKIKSGEVIVAFSFWEQVRSFFGFSCSYYLKAIHTLVLACL